ncbi:MAG: NAD(P)H-dependent oxidoreductase [Candidatus Hydrogenedentota bacterium]
MAYLVISTSLKPDSLSRTMARLALEDLQQCGVDTQWLDLAETPLPICDAADCYSDPNTQDVAALIADAEGILVATPIYNYSCSAAAKNLVELTGQNWTGKVVGFLCAAGGQGSYMAIMGLANHLMLDFRSVIVPRFVYAQGEAFSGDGLADDDLKSRIKDLAKTLVRFHSALAE